MVVKGGGFLVMSEVPLYDAASLVLPATLSSDDVFQETSARYRVVEPEQWLQRHHEVGSSWPSRPKASQLLLHKRASPQTLCHVTPP